ncbi:MAG: MFS transporter, partial [Peptococcaceae bacterium]|nr:MFS transporter [Peptococcaceae bacterium]
MDHQQGSARVHYGWLVLAVGTLAIVGGIGFGRFSYSTVLPNMQADLGLANGPAGFLVTLGLTGYLILAILGGPLIARFGNRKIATAGLVVGGAGMVSLFLADTYLWVAIFSTLAGLGSGAVHMSIFGLWPAWFAKSKRGLASGICVAGGPVGMVLASAALQGLTPLYANKAWQVSWLIFGAYTLAMAVFSFLILRDHPSEKGCRAIGEQEQTAAGAARPGSLDWQSVYREPLIWVLGVVYLIFGFTYISYMTFHVKHLVADIGLPMTSAANLYMLMGWISLISGVLWGWISDFIGRRRTLIILFV